LPLLIVRCLLGLQNAILGLLVRLVFGPQRLPKELPHIWVLRTGALGDFLFAVPALQAIRASFPRSRITLLTTSTTQPSTRDRVAAYAGAALPWTRFVHPGTVDEVVPIPSGAPLAVASALSTTLRVQAPDVVVMLTTPGEELPSLVRKLALFALMRTRAPIRGWRKQASYTFGRAAQYRAGLLRHKVQGALDVAAEIGTVVPPDTQPPTLRIPIADEANGRAEEFLREAGVTSGTLLVALAPGSIHLHKRWPAERYAEVVRALLGSHAPCFMFVGGPDDQAQGELIAAAVPEARFVRAAGQVSIEVSAALLARCALLIANDGGAAHLGSAAGCPVVSIANAIEYPGAVEPWNDREWIVRHDVACSPCYAFTSCPLGHNRCVTEIEAEPVLRLARQRLERA
jgi:heptosyltransferase-2